MSQALRRPPPAAQDEARPATATGGGEKYKPGDVLWVRLPKYPPWPVRVIRTTGCERRRNESEADGVERSSGPWAPVPLSGSSQEPQVLSGRSAHFEVSQTRLLIEFKEQCRCRCRSLEIECVMLLVITTSFFSAWFDNS